MYYPSIIWNGQRWLSTDLHYYEWLKQLINMPVPRFNIGDIVTCNDTNLTGVVICIYIDSHAAHNEYEAYDNQYIKYDIVINGTKFIIKETKLK